MLKKEKTMQQTINTTIDVTPGGGTHIRWMHKEDYTQDEFDVANTMITMNITPKQYMTEKELNMTQFTNSKIEKCIIKNKNEIISEGKTKFQPVLSDVWNYMSSPEKIKKYTTFNIKETNKNGKRGYTWCNDIKLSFQRKDATGTLKEIINMVKVNKLTIDLSIKLKTGRIVHFKI
tara:strand:+ start:222 stop:749 length:528 start_codon:yes stop_codon:yes gene_type:complete